MAVELWKPEFSAYEFGRQVTVADASMALAQAIMLPNDIAALSKETSDMMKSLLVIQHIQVKIMTDAFGVVYLMVSFFLCF